MKHPYTIRLSPNWFTTIHPDAFLEWISEMGIAADQWDFSTVGGNGMGQAIMSFVHEEDAVAFRLKYQI